MMSSPMLLSANFLRKLEDLTLVCANDVSAGAGAHLNSRAAGPGIEFADFRTYSPGEDSRYLDWNAYLRLGKLFLRVNTAEQNTRVYILLDSSGSMDCEDPRNSKLLYAQRLAATFAYLALLRHDRAILVPFAETMFAPLTASGGRNRFWSVLEYLAQVKARGQTNLRRSVSEFLQNFPTRGTVILISDFFDEDGCAAAAELLHFGGYDFIFVQVHSAEEQQPSFSGEFALQDVETGVQQVVTCSRQTALAYERVFLDYSERLRQLATRYGGRYARAVSNIPFEEFVLKSLTANRVLA